MSDTVELLYVFYFLVSIIMSYYSTTLFFDLDRNYHPIFTFYFIKEMWSYKNNFGKLQMILIAILFLPSFIFGGTVVLAIVYIRRFFRWFIELGNKK